jgi:hypothetical protein
MYRAVGVYYGRVIVADPLYKHNDSNNRSLLSDLIECSGELKRLLVEYGQGPRFARQLRAELLEAAGSRRELDESAAIGVIDRFVLQHRLSDGRTVVERYVASRRDLSVAEREMLLGWRDVVEGIFEIQGTDGEALLLLNLIDDLSYRTYSNMGRAAFRGMPKGGFVVGRIVPIAPVTGTWLVSGVLSFFGKSEGPRIAQAALELTATHPALVFRNPQKIEQGWERMRQDRAAFIAFFGSDQLILSPIDVQDQLNAYYAHQQEAALAKLSKRDRQKRSSGLPSPLFRLPEDLAEAESIGIIYDEVEGLSFNVDYGLLEALFTDPALAGNPRHASLLRTYLRDESISPLPFRRLVTAHPSTVDVVFRKVLRKPDFTWAEHGEALLRRRKPEFYEREPRPSVSVIGDRLNDLVSAGGQKR